VDGASENRWGGLNGTDICDYDDDDDYDDTVTICDNSYFCIFVMAWRSGRKLCVLFCLFCFVCAFFFGSGNIPFGFCFALSSCLACLA